MLILAAMLASAQGDLLAIQDAIANDNLIKASHLLQTAMRSAPHDGGLLNLRGIVHVRRGEARVAQEDFLEAVRLAPTLIPAWQNLARICGQNGNWACAERGWKRVLADRPEDQEGKDSLCSLQTVQATPRSVTEMRQVVLAYEQLQRPQDAMKMLASIAEREPGNAADLLEMARLAEGEKHFKEALGYLAHARDLEPGNGHIHFLFGLTAEQMDLTLEAKRSLEKALELEPGNIHYAYALGTVVLKTRDGASAGAYFETYLKLRPGDLNANYALGLALFAGGDYEGCSARMNAAKADPQLEAAAEYYLGRIARLEGKLPEAKERLARSARLSPRMAEPHVELARILLQERDTANAQQELNRALQLAPQNFQANEQLLLLYRRTHDSRADGQAERLKKLDEERSRRAELMLRGIEIQR